MGPKARWVEERGRKGTAAEGSGGSERARKYWRGRMKVWMKATSRGKAGREVEEGEKEKD